MPNKLVRFIKTLNYPAYLIFFVTARCNARCKMCFYEENMEKMRGSANELTVDEYEKISKGIKLINILGISGGEPFLRDDLSEIIKILYRNCSPMVVDLPTNGFFTGNIVRQVADIAGYCKDMTVDVQISIDGPEHIHNEIRGLKDGFQRVKETYKELAALKKLYKNLKVKACVVYSYYNQNYIEELFRILETDFCELDRVVFSVVHGTASDTESFKFDWDRYFKICNKMKDSAVVKNISDFHSIFTIALRAAKNDYLKEILKRKDVYKKCGAGRKVIVINETGKVIPCEPLWYEVGDLRKNNYNLDAVLNSKEVMEFSKKIFREKCTCHWNIPLISNLIYSPRYYPKILLEMFKIVMRSMAGRHKMEATCP